MAHLGSFAASLALPEALRPWAQNGLAALYLPGGLPTHSAPPQSESTPDRPDPVSVAPAPRWPEPWKSLAARVRTAPRVVITYTDLALDLSGTPHPGRRKLFRDILAYLAWPQGTSLFWPLCSLKDGKAHMAPEAFVSGVRHFQVSHVACFGTEAASFARTHLAHEDDALVLELPEPLTLVDRLPHELHIAVKSLKALVLKEARVAITTDHG